MANSQTELEATVVCRHCGEEKYKVYRTLVDKNGVWMNTRDREVKDHKRCEKCGGNLLRLDP